MTVIGISGSPRKNGNTAQMLDRALDGAMKNGALVGYAVRDGFFAAWRLH